MKRFILSFLLIASLLLNPCSVASAVAYDPNQDYYTNLIMHMAYCTGELGYVADGDICRLQCTVCEFQFNSLHASYCTNPGKCDSCGTPMSTYTHYYLRHTSNGPETHTSQCYDCGKMLSTEPHVTACSMPTDTCAYCDQSGLILTGTQVFHSMGDAEVTALGEVHGYVCKLCGEYVHEKHFVYCTQPDQCIVCLASGVSVYDCFLYHGYEISGFCSACNTVTGEKYVQVRLPGDANDDGSVDIFDALTVLQYSTGWSIEVNRSNSDVNQDGECDIFDALLILQYNVGWQVNLL